jgi:DNA-binding CsgD family transcriptional regulator
VRSRVLREAAGNPLALLEVPARLTPGQRAGVEPLPEHLPPGDRLERVFADRLGALPPATRFVLLLCALAGRGAQPPDLIAGAARAAGTSAAELTPAREHGLVDVDPHTGRIAFRHPLAGACVARAATAAERRRAHRALAAALPGESERALTHRVAATDGPDAGLARALAEAGRRAAARGGHGEAGALLARAAELSPGAADRVRRLVGAAHAAAHGGSLATAGRLLGEARRGGIPADARALHDVTHAFVRLHADGDLAPAIDVVTGGPLREAAGTSLFLLLVATGCTDDPAVREAARVALPPGGGAVRTGWLPWDPASADALGDPAPLWERVTRRASFHTMACAALVAARDDHLTGHWDRCLAATAAGASAAGARGHGFLERMFRYVAGHVHAARGDQEELDALAAPLGRWASTRRHTRLLGGLAALRARCALGNGDYEAAYAGAAALVPPGRPPAGGHAVLLDLVEAALHTGHAAQARRHAAAFRAAGTAATGPHPAFVLAAAEALAAPDDAVDAAAHAVYALPGAGRWPFELARVHLHHGAWLRRRHRAVEARHHLAAAHRRFVALRAAPWAGRAEEELCAAGPGGTTPHAALTAQELRVARLAARGLTNRQIGDRLRVSPRTVGAHLYKIFPKLGVSSRAALAQALGE